MPKLIMKNNIYLFSILAVVVAIYMMTAWADLTVMQRLLGVIFIAHILHEWEEFRVPGGFMDAMGDRAGVQFADQDNHEFMVSMFTICLALVPMFFPALIWLAMPAMFIGASQIVNHTVIIKLLNLKGFYSPGLVTAVLMAPFAFYAIYYVIDNDLMTLVEWGYSVLALMALVGSFRGFSLILMRKGY